MLPGPDVLGRRRGQPRQLWSIQARCGRYTLRRQAMRRLLSWSPVLIRPRHGTGRKDIPPLGTACAHGVIPSLLGGKPQRGCSQTPAPPPPTGQAGPRKGGGSRAGSRGLVGCCLCHPIPDSESLSASRFAARAGAILAWIQPTQHFGLSLAVTEPKLRLSVPEPCQMLVYMCLRWPSPRGSPARWGSLRQC